MLGTRAISTTSRRKLSSSSPTPAKQGAEGNSCHSDRNISFFSFLVGLMTYQHPCISDYNGCCIGPNFPRGCENGNRLRNDVYSFRNNKSVGKVQKVSVDKKNQLNVTFCILYFSSNSCSTCFGQPCAHHQELTTA